MGNTYSEGNDSSTVNKIQNAFNRKIKLKANFMIDISIKIGIEFLK